MSSGIYIHVPFCRRRCRYCDFYISTNQKLTGSFTEALINEIGMFSAANGRKKIDSVFFGGGTPSLLDKKQLESILNALRKSFDVSEDTEITLECNPEDISGDENMAKDFHDCGINRLSIGAQSFNDEELKFLTREHNACDSEKSVINAMKHIGNVSVDLIYSIPGQTAEKLLRNLEKAKSLNVPHVSAYTLIFEKGTLLYKQMSSGKVSQNSDETESVLYSTVNDYLKPNGYVHYEVSNYAMPGFESRHNLKYWNFGDYIGFGPSAHSFFERKRWNNVYSVSDYIRIISEGKLPSANVETQTDEMLVKDYFICTLRSKGVDMIEFNKMSGRNFEFEYRKEISDNLLLGNAVIEKGFFRLTEKGYALADSITLEFLR